MERRPMKKPLCRLHWNARHETKTRCLAFSLHGFLFCFSRGWGGMWVWQRSSWRHPPTPSFPPSLCSAGLCRAADPSWQEAVLPLPGSLPRPPSLDSQPALSSVFLQEACHKPNFSGAGRQPSQAPSSSLTGCLCRWVQLPVLDFGELQRWPS